MPPRDGSELGWSRIPVKRGNGMYDLLFHLIYEAIIRIAAGFGFHDYLSALSALHLAGRPYTNSWGLNAKCQLPSTASPKESSRMRNPPGAKLIRPLPPRPAAWSRFSSLAH